MNRAPNPEAGQSARLALRLGALGVVFGDIGTSPLYTMKQSLMQLAPADRADGIYGLLSLITWTLLLVVCLKYVSFIMRADNRGEGGIFALLALSHARSESQPGRGLGATVLIILLGAALLYGDSVITPAITVLSAAEGLESFSPGFTPYIPLIACVILAALFWIQRKGTGTIGFVFGPVMLVWFVTLGLLGLWHIWEAPRILAALNPLLGLNLLRTHLGIAFLILGAVVLTVTGVEALFADMGHFGRKAITHAWYGVVLPGLLLNYYGQGAHILADPISTANPFFALASPGWGQLALTILAMVAAIIASQSVISGAYSMTRSAIQLGYFPRLKVLHTNAEMSGQIYLPLVNISLALVAIAIVLGFKSSDHLAAAYGIAVTGTMCATSYAFYHVARRRWQWPAGWALALCSAFIVVDLIFFVATMHKFTDGGWLPIGIALFLIAIMNTWKRGKNEIREKVYSKELAELELSQISQSKSILRVPGSAVFMASSAKGVPLALLHHLKANKCLQETAVLMTIMHEDVPYATPEERLAIEDHTGGVWRAIVRYGYMESPNLSDVMQRLKEHGVPINIEATTFYFNREMIITGGSSQMWEWQKSFYSFLSRNAQPVKDYYQIRPTQLIEIGLPVQL